MPPIRLKTVHLTTTSGAPYALNDCIGGLQSIVGNAFDAGSDTSLRRITVQDRDKESKPLDIHFFSEGPLVSSIFDNAQFNLSYPDHKRKLATVSIAAADYKTHISGSTASATVDIPMINVSNQGMMHMAVESKSPNATPIAFSTIQSLSFDLLFK